jgi:hypothetical protein
VKPCPLCSHASVNEINRLLIAGTDAATVARQYRVPHRSALHHRRYHLPRLLRKVREVDQQLEATALRKILVDIGQEMRGLYEQFKTTKDFRGAIVALDKLLGWWQTAAAMIGIAEPPEGYHAQPLDVAQAARELYGLTEMPTLTVAEQKALPPGREPEETDAGPPVAQPAAGPPAIETHLRVVHIPDIERKLAAAKPVQDTRYQKLLDQAHAEGRRLEPGEASPHMLGWDVDARRKPN